MEVKVEVNSLRSWKLYAKHRTIALASHCIVQHVVLYFLR